MYYSEVFLGLTFCLKGKFEICTFMEKSEEKHELLNHCELKFEKVAALFASNAKINVFESFSPTEQLRRVKKISLKMFILAFEVIVQQLIHR